MTDQSQAEDDTSSRFKLSAEDLTINDSVVKKCVSTFDFALRHLGINIKAHHETTPTDSLFKDGDIFLFNHFARFETIVPGHLIYHAAQCHTRTLAHRSLFQGPPKYARFLASLGAVPNDLDGLLAFLAAEILRGRKLVVFPEGGMIKDRLVTGDDGELGIFSDKTQSRRKHHTGASAVAIVLEIFKRRIVQVAESGNKERLGRWAAALQIEEIDELVEKARRPTKVVPGNITFFPIRGSENLLSRGVSLFVRGIADNFKEELLVESNILVKNTDMDIRFADPMVVDFDWSWWQRRLLDWSFNQINSLDELFDANAVPNRFIDKMGSHLIHQNIRRLRDQSMETIYQHTTVNIAHLTSRLLVQFYDHGVRNIELSDLRNMLYRAIKLVQSIEGAFLHRGLEDPHAYRGLLDGDCQGFEEFLAIGCSAGLFAVNEQKLELLSDFNPDKKARHLRLENPVLVYANEILPLEEICQAIDLAFAAGIHLEASDKSKFYFDDELRSFEWSRHHFSKPRYQEINKRQETTADNGPVFLSKPENGHDLGLLLIHDFMNSPQELKSLGEQLHTKYGLPTFVMRLPGHGTSPWELRDKSWIDWLLGLRQAYEILSCHAERIVMIGSGAGAVLALRHGAENPTGLAGVAAVSIYERWDGKTQKLLPAVLHIDRFSQWAWSREGIWPFYGHDPEHPKISYKNVPVRGLFELYVGIDDCKRHLGDVTCPVLLVQPLAGKSISDEEFDAFEQKLVACPKTIIRPDSVQQHLLYEKDLTAMKAIEELIAGFLPERPAKEVVVRSKFSLFS